MCYFVMFDGCCFVLCVVCCVSFVGGIVFRWCMLLLCVVGVCYALFMVYWLLFVVLSFIDCCIQFDVLMLLFGFVAW